MEYSRYTVTSSAGSRGRNKFAVIDRQTIKDWGMARVSWHPTFRQAKEAARKLNREARNA